MIYLGLISGTSMDGIDAVAARFEGPHFKELLASSHSDYAPALQQRLLRIAREQPALTAREWCVLDAEVGDAFAETALALIDANPHVRGKISAIGSHGQTLFHDAGKEPRLSLQLGDPNRIAARCGVSVVADFRRRDLALGGQGAPLVPAFHHALFASADEPRAVLNLGGIANLTLLPVAGTAEVRGFDTGPANGLLDEWASLHLGQAFDDDGQFARRGAVHQALLRKLLSAPFFALPPPKSSGRGDFHLAWVRTLFPDLDRLAPEDVQATLAEMSAQSIAMALQQADFKPRRILACGGGVRNSDLMRRIAASMPDVALESTAPHGLDAQWIEATAFAWLAAQTLNDLPGNLPSVTGARRPAILGGIYTA